MASLLERIREYAQGKQAQRLREIEDVATGGAAAIFGELAEGWERTAADFFMVLVGDAAGTLDPDDAVALAENLFTLFNPALTERGRLLETAIRDSVTLGAAEGAAQVVRGFPELGQKRINSRSVLQDPLIVRALDGVAGFTDQARTTVRRDLLAAAQSGGDLSAITGAVHRSLSKIQSSAQASASWTFNKAANTAASEQILANGAVKMWVAERDACLHCLALSGQTTTEGFDPGSTYATKSTSAYGGILPEPPRHPHCRCRIVPWKEDWRGGEVAAPEALSREAERSVLQGKAAASEAERLRAADRTLEDTDLPQTVQQRARRAVRRGSF